MNSCFIDACRSDPPTMIVVGVEVFADALASVLGAVLLPLGALRAGPTTAVNGDYPLVLEGLRHTLLVLPEEMPPSEAIQCHRCLWNWVQKLSSAGDQHDLSFVFVLPPFAGSEYERSLAAGLSLPSLDPATTGHAAWRQGDTLEELLALFATLHPVDRMTLKALERTDSRRAAFCQLRAALHQGDLEYLQAAVSAIHTVFQDAEYLLDLFCREPSHHHGNLLRRWLHEGVTGAVTQDWRMTAINDINGLLAVDDGKEPA